jgi:hypothetical protein
VESRTIAAGAQEFNWDGRTAEGRFAAPGVYFVRARLRGEARDEVATIRVVVDR